MDIGKYFKFILQDYFYLLITFAFRELQKRTSRLTLRFRSSSTERQYDRHREPLSAIPLLSLPLAAVAALVSQWIAVPLPSMEAVNLEKDQATKLETAVSIAVTVILAVITLGAAAETAPRVNLSNTML